MVSDSVDSMLNDCEIHCSLVHAAKGAAVRPRQSRRERPRVWRELWIFCELFRFFPSFLLDGYTLWIYISFYNKEPDTWPVQR